VRAPPRGLLMERWSPRARLDSSAVGVAHPAALLEFTNVVQLTSG